MRLVLPTLFFALLFSSKNLFGQAPLLEGAVSYVSSQNVYVKFASTKAIAIGDTLFLKNGESTAAALVVNNKSSGSTVCTRLEKGAVFKVGDALFARARDIEKALPEKNLPKKEKEGDGPDAEGQVNPPEKSVAESVKKPKPKISSKQKLRTRFSAASYSNFNETRETHRLRYGLTVQGKRIGGSRWSTDNNLVFRHTLGDWAEVRENVNTALKIYSLSATYHLTEGTSLTAGRRINPRMASLGAIDGLQFERGFARNWLYGAVLGSRPDPFDYGFAPKLFETGAFVGFAPEAVAGRSAQATVGFLEQKNRWLTDRRYLYSQVNFDATKDLNLFASAEADLFEKVDEVVSNRARLTNLLASARYRFSKKLNAAVSYDNRRNVVFYESFKQFIELYTEQESRQGLRGSLNWRPVRLVNLGASAGWRFQKSGDNESRNLHAFLNLNRLPVVKASASLTANFLETGYIRSRSLGARLSRDFLKGKLNAEAYYRNVFYRYPGSGHTAGQQVGGASLSLNFSRSTSLFLFAEKTFDSGPNDFLLFNTKLSQRF